MDALVFLGQVPIVFYVNPIYVQVHQGACDEPKSQLWWEWHSR